MEDSIIAIEDLVFNGGGGKYLSFELETLTKAWEVLAGMRRPDPVRDKKKRVIERFFPEKALGYFFKKFFFNFCEILLLNSLISLTSLISLSSLSSHSSYANEVEMLDERLCCY